MDFENFCESYVDKHENSKTEQAKFEQNKNVKNQKLEANSISEEDIKRRIDKYKNYNSEQLLTELLAEANKQKKNGNLTDKNLQKIIANLSPYLDASQKERLNQIIKMLR